ncbi:MAG: hypothetical protein U5J95_03810 [Balneolaceae bacterium]|nr:hypothetical protein [Balneolaceae bacterium]
MEYSVIYYIHADADYLYHDASGDPVKANSQVLDTALSVAEDAKSGEVFVFYQRPEKKFLGLFPRRSSQLYHYINGELTGHLKYRHADKKEDFLTTEARIYNQYRSHSGKEDQRNYFLYFGHEIPDNDGKKYHRTLPDIAVNTTSFSGGIQKFLVTDEQRFDLIVLSTCNNGTPVMAEHLMPFSDILLASPQNLHLSHIDSKSLDLLESDPGISSIQVADSMADQTFRRLEKEVQTTITLTVYDLEIVQEYKNALHAFATKYEALDSMQYFSDNVDCNQVEFFDDDTFGKGLHTWFKPAKFGRRSSNSTHSGWGCKPLIQN